MEEFLGAIGLFGFGLVPKNWMVCAGQLLPIPQNQALFSLLGTTYGGNGSTNFALPDLQGRAIVGASPAYLAGSKGGVETAPLASGQMPTHYHTIAVSTAVGNSTVPEGSVIAASAATANLSSPPPIYAQTGAGPLLEMGAGSIGPAGSSVPHENMQPFQTLNYCICVVGHFPSRH